MKVIRAGAGTDEDLSARSAAIFRRIVGREDLNFLRGIHIGCANAGAIRAGANSRSAVIRDQTLRRARTIDIGWTLGEIETKIRKRAAASSRHKIGHENRVSTVNLKGVDLLTGNKLLHRRRFRLHLNRGCRNLHRLIAGAYGQRRINDYVGARIDLVSVGLISLETGGFNLDRVQPRGHIGDRVIAGFVRSGLALYSALVSHRNLGVRNRGAGGIFYKPRNRAQIRLRV